MKNNLENEQTESVNMNIHETVEAVDNTAETAETPAQNKNPYEELFTPDEIKLIEDYAGKINITDESILAGYGAAVQKKASDIVTAASLGAAGRDDSTAVSAMEELVRLIGDMESPEGEKTGILAIFKTKGGKLEVLSEKFELAEPVADEVSLVLDGDKELFLGDAKLFGELYETCLNCIKEMTMYIAAGKMKLDHERNVTLMRICEFAKKSGEAADIDAASDFADMCLRFGERIGSLEQIRACIMQAAPRIMLIRNNCAAMCEMIGEINTNALNVWKRHAASALGIDKVGSAVKMPGSAFDREFLSTINTEMIDFMSSVIERYKKVGEERTGVEADLRAIESELKQKLLSIASFK